MSRQNALWKFALEPYSFLQLLKCLPYMKEVLSPSGVLQHQEWLNLTRACAIISEKTVNGPSSWTLATHMGDMGGSRLLVLAWRSPGCYMYLSSESLVVDWNSFFPWLDLCFSSKLKEIKQKYPWQRQFSSSLCLYGVGVFERIREFCWFLCLNKLISFFFSIL